MFFSLNNFIKPTIETNKPIKYKIGMHIINAKGNFEEIIAGKRIPPKNKMMADIIPINMDNFT